MGLITKINKRNLFIPILLVSINCYSQNTDTLEIHKLEEVVVTATRNEKLLSRSPGVIHLVTSRDIELLNVSSTGEILEYLTGVNIESGTGSGFPKRSIISLDGFPASYSLVMVDGIRLLTEHIHTGQNIDLIPPECIERIEIIKGSGSAQYGSDAMGGVINIITKESGNKANSNISFSAGSYNTYNTTLSLRTPLNEKVKVSTFSNYEESAGTDLLAPAHRIGNMGYNKFSTMNNISWSINSNSTLRSNVYYTQNSMEFFNDDVYGSMLLSSVDYTNNISNNLSVTTRAKFSHWNAEQSSEINNLLNPEVFARWTPHERNTITAGIDYKLNKFSRSAVSEHTQETIGIFAQDEIDFNRLSLLLALRIDKVEKIDPVITPQIAIRYDLNNKIRLRASAGRGFHAPSVQELYEEGYGHGGRAYRFGNPDLQPEYSFTATGSFEYEPTDKLQFLIHGYYNTISNMISPVYSGIWEENPDTTTVIDKWIRTNIHEARIFGIETTMRYHILNKLMMEAGYNYTDNKNVSTGKQLPYYPGESFFAKVIYSYNISKSLSVSSHASLRATKNRSSWNWKPASGAETDSADGLITELRNYQLLNAGIKLTYRGKTDFYLNFGNLLAQDIQKLDDLLTETKGQVTWKFGCIIRL